MVDLKVRLYQYVKYILPRRMQIALRRRGIKQQRRRFADVWPIYEPASKPPDRWPGWPNGKKFAFVLTHDVDTQKGHDRSLVLADIEERLGFRSVFNFVANDYYVSPKLREQLVGRGFEIGVHGLYHNSKLYHSREEFLKQAPLINQVLKDWKAVGFRSPCMYHNLEWLHDFEVEYDASTFDTDPFEPQPDGVHSIFPIYVSQSSGNKGYVELPYTLPQDFTVFIMMREKTTDIWKQKLEWIARNGGMVLLNTHPDYMNFGGGKHFSEYEAGLYRDFLEYTRITYQDQYWHPLPRQVARFWADHTRRLEK